MDPAELCRRTVDALAASGAPIAGAGVATGTGSVVLVHPADDTNSRFEIGSVTKMVTGLVLGQLVMEGRTALEAHIGKWLDAGANSTITLEELATHTSGLPRLAPNHFDHQGYDEKDPYAAFTADLAEEGVRSAQRTQPGTFLYSNFGYQLLGVCLERTAGKPLPELFREVVFDRLQMTSATTDPAEAVLRGVGTEGAEPNWHLLLHGPGGINASASDLLRLIAAYVRPPSDDFGSLVEIVSRPRALGPGAHLGLGCMVLPDGTVCMGGGTAGFSTYVVGVPTTGLAVACATNRHIADVIQTIAFTAAAGDDPLPTVPQPFEGDPSSIVARASELFDLLVALDFEGSRALMAPETAAVLTAERLQQGWAEIAAPCGSLGSALPTEVVRVGGATRVTLTADGEHRPLTMVSTLDDELRVIGVVIR